MPPEPHHGSYQSTFIGFCTDWSDLVPIFQIRKYADALSVGGRTSFPIFLFTVSAESARGSRLLVCHVDVVGNLSIISHDSESYISNFNQ